MCFQSRVTVSRLRSWAFRRVTWFFFDAGFRCFRVCPKFRFGSTKTQKPESDAGVSKFIDSFRTLFFLINLQYLLASHNYCQFFSTVLPTWINFPHTAMVHRKNDIDKKSDLHLSADPAFFQDIRDVLIHMRKQESGTYHRSSRKLPEPFNGAWRKQIVEWMYTLVKHCKLRHEAAAGGAYFLDAAVAKGVITSPEDYQLGALASLYLGLKVFDSPGTRVVRLSSLVKLGNADFTEDDIVRMERSIVLALGWHLNPPTANCFLQQYLCLLPISGENLKNNVEDRAFTIIEKSLANDRLRGIKSSELGFSALIMGIDGYLKDQKNVARDKDDERITVEQLRRFFYNMKTVAGLDYRDATGVNHWMALVERATSDRLSSATTTTTSTFILNHDREKIPRGNTTEAVRGPATEKGGLSEEATGQKSAEFLSMTMATHHSPTNVMLQ